MVRKIEWKPGLGTREEGELPDLPGMTFWKLDNKETRRKKTFESSRG